MAIKVVKPAEISVRIVDPFSFTRKNFSIFPLSFCFLAQFFLPSAGFSCILYDTSVFFKCKALSDILHFLSNPSADAIILLSFDPILIKEVLI